MAKTVLCLCLCLTICQVRSVPVKMNKTIQSLLQFYGHDKLPLRVRFSGETVFPREFAPGRIEVNRLLLGGIMETYEELLTRMINQLPTTGPRAAETSSSPPSGVPVTQAQVAKSETDSIRGQLHYILTKIQDLRTNVFAEQDKILHKVYMIKPIQMDDKVIQSKALWELQYLYEEARALNDVRRRRRRHAHKIKTA
ncbi:interferon gamma [Neosynchiropus ocellatus]